ncbi:MAG TPA: ABC transporter permease, partial [Gemmatimonadales bacterium]|nr:ABC transporter permease [Gemmatimonadales bacterium]
LEPHRRTAIVLELSEHLEDRYQELLGRGMSGVDAAAAVRGELERGDLLRAALAEVEPPPPAPLEPQGQSLHGGWLSDVRYGVRTLLRRPGLTFIALLTLSLGIGATTAIFSVVNEVLLRGLPFRDPDRIIHFLGSAPDKGLPEVSWPEAFYAHFHARSRTLDPLAIYTTNEYTLTGLGDAERLFAANVTAEFFPLLGVQPILGRGFEEGEDAARRANVTVLSWRLWQRRFSGDSGIVGKTLSLSGTTMTVVGIMPPGFDFPERSELWVPAQIDPASLDCWCYDGIGRLADGVTEEDARQELANLADQYWRERDPNTPRTGHSIILTTPLANRLVGTARDPLLVLFAGVGMVLLIACANLANLLLARANARAREIAVRCCLGASPRRVVRQLLVESGLLAILGGLGGLALAWAGVRALSPVVSERLHHIQGISIHPMVLAFTLGVTALTGLLFGLAPALRATRVDLQRTLKEGGRTTGTAGGRRLNDSFVVAQFAFSLILLTGAGLLIRSFRNLLAIDPGFRPEHVLTARVSLPWPRYDETRVHGFQDRLLESLQGIPGTRAAAIAESVPFSQGDNQQEFVVEGREPGPTDPIPVTSVWAVSPGYFAAVGTALIDGRGFTESDRDSASPVLIIDRTMADKYWPGGGAIGQRIRLGARTSNNRWATIVGLAGEIRHQNLGEAPNYRVYLPIAQHTRWRTRVAIRTEGDPLALTRQVREVVRGIDPELPVFGFETLEQSVANSLSTERLTNRLLLGFAGVALLLAAIGIYGVMSLNVGSRIGEFGIRMALGASPGQVRRLVVRHGLMLVLPGVALGLLGAAALTRFLGSLLFGVKPIDPLTFGLVTGLLLVVAAAACWVPARRAVAADPLTSLRGE